ncbi:hypothetical protein [Paracraurococcus lichenis]|uniref:Uncharacterized protein n=1 Tax=Paracraurococcus lichenis TaxID=3064888 RepID=A0ABT9EB73_9PROT|nr:hypothetical protein [Paracraurococcus sp. LOR1-02]MDO9713382.1 hypothetical protein [Paracraurococcus sp. LOR1-02]
MSNRNQSCPDGAAPATARRHGAVEKLRSLVAHPTTEDVLRAVARDRLDVLAPRRATLVAGAPRRRASDRVAAITGGARRLVQAAYGGMACVPGREEVSPRLDLLV